jgi:hypothetical protein
MITAQAAQPEGHEWKPQVLDGKNGTYRLWRASKIQ